MIYYAKIKSGGIIFDMFSGWEKDCRKFEDQEVQIEVKKLSKDQTIAQRNYFHKILDVFSNETGDSFDDLKVTIKKHYGVWEETTDIINGEKDRMLKSTSDYTRAEYIQLINGFIGFIREFYPDFIIPAPKDNKLNNEDYNNY